MSSSARNQAAPPKALHRKALIAQCGWWRGRMEAGYAHDWEFLSRVLAAAQTWACTQKPTFIYHAETSGQGAFLSRKRHAVQDASTGYAPI